MRKITNIRKEDGCISGDISLEYLKYYKEVLEALNKIQSNENQSNHKGSGGKEKIRVDT